MSVKPFHAAMIAGTHSSVGKTLWTLALSALCRQKGLTVQPFKAGPDYIDPSFHHELCAPRRSRNLDLFLMKENPMRDTFNRNVQGADIALVEGMMGLFDGKGIDGEESSSAQIAKKLKLPVLLVLDGAGLASTAAAFVLGFQKYDPELNLAGVLINRVNRESHFNLLKNAIESKTGVPCLGYLPKDKNFEIPERHLGLTTALEFRPLQPVVENFDWERFLSITTLTPSLSLEGREGMKGEVKCRIGVAYDKAFSFYYEDNLDALRNEGAELVFFSPLNDVTLPENLDALYFGGGFPEIYADPLSRNRAMMQSIQNFGGLIYAECGGLIYLTQAGLIPGTIRMTGRLQHFGYHEIETASETFLWRKGKRLRSHEFHYSTWEHEAGVAPAYRIGERAEGYASPRLVASYQHLHFASDPELPKSWVQQCRKHSLALR